MRANWVIKNAAPQDERLRMWGDFHFGNALAEALAAHGIDAVNQYHGVWNDDEPADVVLVLRGKHRYDPPAHRRARSYMIWVISHPAEVGVEELRAFDDVFVCSARHQERLARAGIQASVLLQCTDPDRFHPNAEPQTRRGVLFVGNTRSADREVVRLAVDGDLPLEIYGRGWAAFGLADRVVDQYLANEELGDLYRRTRLTLNDHWPDMRDYGYVNNRVFDAVACGLPVLSDWTPGLDALGLPGVLTFRDERGFADGVRESLLRYPALLRAAAEGSRLVLAEHTFEQRAATLAARSAATAGDAR